MRIHSLIRRWLLPLAGIAAIGLLVVLSGLWRAGSPSAAETEAPSRNRDQSPVSADVARATDLSPMSVRAREVALATLPSVLEKNDAQKLLDFALGTPPADFSLGRWHAYVNSCFNLLRSTKCDVPEFAERLTALVRNAKADPVLRDYAIQHLRARYADDDPGAARESDPVQRNHIEETLRWSVSQRNRSWSGTAIVALDHIQRQSGGALKVVTPPEIDRLALELAISPDSNDLARITAIQICAERRLAEILPSVRSLALDMESRAALRVSAIGALGLSGDASDLAVLQICASDKDSRIARAAGPAIRRLSPSPPTPAN